MQKDFLEHLYKIAEQYEDINKYIVILNENKKDSVVWNDLGKALFQRSLFAEAIQCYDKAVEVDPKDVRGYNGKGAALGSLGRYEEAIKWYDKAVEVDPKNVDSLEGLEYLYSDHIYDFKKALE